MCGRYYIEEADMSGQMRQLVETARGKAEARGLEIKTGEIFPSDIVPVIACGRGLKPAVFPMKWGFPSAVGERTLINARSETADAKPLFRRSAGNRRCLLPATNYFEWEKSQGKKTKYSIKTPGPGVMYLAGLYTCSESCPFGEFAILTRQAAGSIAFIHDRMPVIIPEGMISRWLSQAEDYRSLLADAADGVEYTGCAD
jgi:putative SOS response-associated peptidase YedK